MTNMIFRLYKDKNREYGEYPSRKVWRLHVYKEKLPKLYIDIRRDIIEFGFYRFDCILSSRGVTFWYLINRGNGKEGESYSRGVHLWRKKKYYASGKYKRIQLVYDYGYEI